MHLLYTITKRPTDQAIPRITKDDEDVSKDRGKGFGEIVWVVKTEDAALVVAASSIETRFSSPILRKAQFFPIFGDLPGQQQAKPNKQIIQRIPHSKIEKDVQQYTSPIKP